MSEWKEYKLGEIANTQTGPFGSQLHAADYVCEGIPSIMPTNIGRRLNIIRENLVYITFEDATRLEKYLVEEGDIVYSRRGDVEKCAYITINEQGWLCGTGCLRVRIKDKTCVNPLFCAYYLSTDEMKSYISSSAVGTTMPNLNTSILNTIPLMLPPLEEQERIAGILSSLDDKIELLGNQNRTLEELVQTLFRHHFIENPNPDWKLGKLDEEMEIIMGQSPSGTSYNENKVGIPMFQGNADFNFRFPTNRVYTTEPKKMAREFDTLISVRAPVGEQNMALEECCIGRGVAAFRYKIDNTFYSYTYYKMKSLMSEITQFNDTGTVFGSISKSDFCNIESLVPDAEAINVFQTEVNEYDSKIHNNTQQINTLTKLRDTLLPKLMSNEIKI